MYYLRYLSLDLAAKRIGGQNLSLLSDSICKHISLRSLSLELGGNEIGNDDGVKSLVATTKLTNINYLDLKLEYN